MLQLQQPEEFLSFLLISLINASSLIYFLKIKADLEWLYIKVSARDTCRLWDFLFNFGFFLEEKSQYDGKVKLIISFFWFALFARAELSQ